MRKYLFISLLICPGLLPVQAEDTAKSVVRESVRAAFEEFERQTIYKYFEDHPEYARDYFPDYDGRDGHRKKGRKGLPPGIAMKLERGGTLPPGIAKKQLPPGLSGKLPAPPAGYERTVVGNDVVLVEVDTGRIADIISDVILGSVTH